MWMCQSCVSQVIQSHMCVRGRVTDHGLSEVVADPGQEAGVGVVGDGLHDGRCPSLRLAALEDAGADKHTVHTKLHHQ